MNTLSMYIQMNQQMCECVQPAVHVSPKGPIQFLGINIYLVEQIKSSGDLIVGIQKLSTQ